MTFVAELWQFMRARKKYWLLPIILHDGAVRRPDRADPGHRGRAVHLHDLLIGSGCVRILGISAFYHDSAAALVERRRDRRRRPGRALHPQEARCRLSPRMRSRYCLAEAGIGLDQIDHVAFYDKPFLKFERLLETYLAFAPKGFRSFRMAMPLWLKEKLFQKRLLREELSALADGHGVEGRELERRLLFTEHHQSHAASAFYPSPFDEAAVLTIDGVGEWATTSVGHGPRASARDAQGDHVPALARAALLGLHLLHRLQGQFRRVQGDGAGALRRAEICADDPRPPDRRQAGRLVPPQPWTISTTAPA